METPEISTLFKSIERDKDKRGSILSIVDTQVRNVSIITCNANVLRSNHYHKKDFHFMYVMQGEIDYFFKDIDTNIISYFKVSEGDIIFTPPNEIHATFFPKETKLIVSSFLPRDRKTYEEDTVRVDFINSKNINSMIEKYAKD
jgi:oxalate decarboxylase/phosphoglucose isomerase-like protein (cupin superfamily)